MGSNWFFLFGIVGAGMLATACGARTDISSSPEPGDAATTPAADAATPPVSNGTILGPYGFIGNRGSVAMQTTYNFELAAESYAIFTTAAPSQLGGTESVLSGLFRVPAGSAVGAGWVCPGPNAVWFPLSAAECRKGNCAYSLFMPSPSQLSCAGASTNGTLAIVPGPSLLSSASSSIPSLNGIQLGVPSFQILTPVDGASRAGSIYYGDPDHYRHSTEPFIEIIFDGKPVAPVGANPAAPGTELTLSNISVIYHPNGGAGPTELICATGGIFTLPASTTTVPTISLTGVSDPISCPGTPLAPPLSLFVNNVPNGN